MYEAAHKNSLVCDCNISGPLQGKEYCYLETLVFTVEFVALLRLLLCQHVAVLAFTAVLCKVLEAEESCHVLR